MDFIRLSASVICQTIRYLPHHSLSQPPHKGRSGETLKSQPKSAYDKSQTVSLIFTPVHSCPHRLNMVGRNIFVILHHLVNDTVWRKFNDTVRHGLDKLMVVRGKEDISFINLQVIIKCLNRLQVKMVSRRI